MTIPNAKDAVVNIRKLRDYCLNPYHEIGKFKARVFASALDIKIEDAEELSEALLQAVRSRDAQLGRFDKFGQRYTVDFEFEHFDKKAIVRSAWIVERERIFRGLRLVLYYEYSKSI